jgi:hypothetical protein
MFCTVFIHPVKDGLCIDVDQEVLPGCLGVSTQKSHHPALVDRFVEIVFIVGSIFYPFLAAYGSHNQIGSKGINGESDYESNEPTFYHFDLKFFYHDHWNGD